MMHTFAGMKIVVSQHATKTVYHWPNKKRSRRLIKKLTKLRGPQITTEPTSFVMTGGLMVVHPSIFDALKRDSEANKP